MAFNPSVLERLCAVARGHTRLFTGLSAQSSGPTRATAQLAASTIASLLIACSFATAQTASDKSDAPPAAPALTTPDAPIELPDTPAGRALKSFLGSIAVTDALMTEQQFSPEFIKAVPMKQFEKLTADLRTANGELVVRSIEPGGTPTKLAIIARGTKSRKSFRIPISTDDKGVINGLFIAPAPTADTPVLKSWEDLNARLKPLAESVAFGAYELGEPKDEASALSMIPVHELDADVPLAIGSTFKLNVLGALAEKMLRGETSWTAELAVEDDLKSLPSGVMQGEKDGTKLPIRIFAEKMISISDNTATDHLFHLVGREQVEAFYRKFNTEPTKTLPFLCTREMFAIKLSPDRTLGERYAKATETERRAMIAPPPDDAKHDGKAGEVYTTKPSIALASFWAKPVLIDQVEWFMSTKDACREMAELERLARTKSDKADLSILRDVLGMNPGLPLDKKVWKHSFYKGGSEPGVLNLTWLLERDDGKLFAASMTLNDTHKAVKQEEAFGLAVRAIELLGKRE